MKNADFAVNEAERVDEDAQLIKELTRAEFAVRAAEESNREYLHEQARKNAPPNPAAH